MFKLFFSPTGAIHRLHYLYGLILSVAILLFGYVCAYLPLVALTNAAHHPHVAQYGPKLGIMLYALTMILAFVSTWINICVHLKRLYDLRMPRFLVVIPFFYVMSQQYIPNSIQNTLMIILVTAYIICLSLWPSRRDEASEANA